MILKYYGHSFFTLTLENGSVIAFDPYGTLYEYPRRLLRADVCLISHHHYDHDGLSCLEAGAEVIDTPGEHKLACGASVVGVPTFHDGQGGALRGKNTFFIIEAEGLRVGHAGDLGHLPTRAQAAQIGRLDLLMLPVGGYYTIDAAQAMDVCGLLKPTVTIPMHYRTQYDPEMNIAPLADFLSLCGAEDTQMPLLRAVKAEMGERPPVVTLAVQPG